MSRPVKKSHTSYESEKKEGLADSISSTLFAGGQILSLTLYNPAICSVISRRKKDEDYPLDIGVNFQALAGSLHCDVGGFIYRITIDAGADRGKSDRL